MSIQSMSLLSRVRASAWTAPLIAAILIVSSWGVAPLAGRTIADALMLAAAVVAGTRIVISAARALVARSIGIDLLVAVAAMGAIALRNFWEAAAVTTLFGIGHALERMTLARTRSALADLVQAAPDVAVVVRNGIEVEIPSSQVTAGETVVVKAGAALPVDGTVTSGTGAVNEASITGESIPAEKSTGDRVYAGTVLAGGHLRIEAASVGAETTLARIIRRVEDAQDAKAPTQTFMERFSRWYTPGIILLAVVTGLITRDIELALTLLVIGCPGALVISIPVAIVAGVGRGAKDGVLIKGGEHLERAARIDTVALDKTGTLTVGSPVLTDVIPLSPRFPHSALLAFAGAAESGSEHPLAQPIVAAADEEELRRLTSGAEFRPAVGNGVVALVDGHHVVVGKPQLLADEFPGVDLTQASQTIDELGQVGRTAMAVGIDGVVAGVIAVADASRPDAGQTLADLRRAGIQHVVMLTGDRESVARAVAADTGITDVRAELLPDGKLEAIAQLQRAGHRVAMIGDGVNDAPAIATADTGIAMGAAGSDLAVETADIALMADRLDRLPYALRLARSTVRVMRQNIIIAVATVALLLAGVFLGGVTMSLGMLVHEASVLIVIANAMRLLRLRPRPGHATAPSVSTPVRPLRRESQPV